MKNERTRGCKLTDIHIAWLIAAYTKFSSQNTQSR